MSTSETTTLAAATEPCRDVYDVVVIGAGIHGAGVAEAAAEAGWHVLVLEKHAPGSGTSCRSSKLIHGGLRYLESAQFSLVRQSLRDRNRLIAKHPDLVKLRPFLIPVYEDSKRPPWKIRAGLSLYAVLGGLRAGTRFRSVPKSEWALLDGLRTDGLRHVFEYQDGQTDDRRLTETIMQSAVDQSAQLVCPVSDVRVLNRGSHFDVSWTSGGSQHACRAVTLVNAGGPWVNQVATTIDPRPPMIDIDLVQGTHLVLDVPLSARNYYAESPRDGRPVFTMPWKDRTLIGTTETRFEGSPDDVRPLADEEEYLLDVYRHYFPSRSPQVIDKFAGLRVLPRQKSGFNRRSRETIFVKDDPRLPRYVAIYGGKLTTFHSTARQVTRLLSGALTCSPKWNGKC